MKRIILFVTVSCFLVGCNKQMVSTHEDSEANQSAQGQNAIQSFSPRFDVNVALSKKAEKRLDQLQETIIIFGGISGEPKPGVKEEDLDETGRVHLHSLSVEMKRAGVFRFSDIDLPEKQLEQVEHQDYHLLINIASGRKSSQYNLLDCGVYLGSIKAVQDHTIDIQCRLIGE